MKSEAVDCIRQLTIWYALIDTGISTSRFDCIGTLSVWCFFEYTLGNSRGIFLHNNTEMITIRDVVDNFLVFLSPSLSFIH
ncbi:MAG: hypothetical protein K0S04_4535 [Herbinix sp.]|nr:hypothetical protein [Herbinix sp.]